MTGEIEVPCPCCFSPLQQTDATCGNPGCGYVLPNNYYETCSEAPPIPIVTLGFETHGKTSLLAALLMTLRDLPGRVQHVRLSLLGQTKDQAAEWFKAAAAGQIPGKTPERNQADFERSPEPMIFSVKGLLSPRTLLIYDIAGEDFHVQNIPKRYLPALGYAQTVWFVVSPADLQGGDVARSARRAGTPAPSTALHLIDNLSDWYQKAMKGLGVSSRGRKAVIVFTKGDLLDGTTAGKQSANRDEIERYLDSDPYAHGADRSGIRPFPMEEYLSRLEEISGLLDDVNLGVNGGPNLARLLSDELSMEVHYAITAPLGARVDKDGVVSGEAWKRKRVIDPLLWTLSLEAERRTEHGLYLVLDSAEDAVGIHSSADGSEAVAQRVWSKVVESAGVKILYLGQPDPCLAAAARPPAVAPESKGLRLIGPLLDALPDTARVIVVTTGTILDLPDFASSGWDNRLLVVVPDARTRAGWHDPQTVSLKEGTAMSRIAAFATVKP